MARANPSCIPRSAAQGDGYADRVETRDDPGTGRLTEIAAGQLIPFGGDKWTRVPSSIAEVFREGDRLVVVQTSGDVLHISAAVSQVTDLAVQRARAGFDDLATRTADQISAFYESFARNLADDDIFASIREANAADVDDARKRGRSTTRLVLDDKMRHSMVEALRMWRDLPDSRDVRIDTVSHKEWSVSEMKAPLGVVGFIFEGRPNVFADATGVLRSGNTAVFRIGSDALGTARAMMTRAVAPALEQAGLPEGAVVLLDSAERSAGHALFSHPDIALAVARGSGTAVAQLGAVARQSGIPVSLHGTGGAWMLVAKSAAAERVIGSIDASLDRKVCNTVNVICVLRSDPDALDAVLTGLDSACVPLAKPVRVHVVGSSTDCRVVEAEIGLRRIELLHDPEDSILALEWEWDDVAEVSLRFVDELDEAIDLFNEYSPQFVISVITSDPDDVDRVYRRANAPFVGDGFTRWVDGQYALSRPELGLSNWQGGRLFARGGILSGDGVFSVRYRATHNRSDQRR